MKIIAIDAGNTHLRMALVDTQKKRVKQKVHIRYKECEAYIATIIEEVEEESLPLAISTVVEKSVPFFRKLSKKTDHISTLLFAKAAAIESITFRYNQATLGPDRVVDAVAALALFPNRDLIVIDSGTATTVDFITSERLFLGGYIMAGIGLKATALAEKTDKLPWVDIYTLGYTHLPKSTKEAIETGLIIDTIGGVERAVVEGEKILTNPLIITCGGGWKIVGNYFSKKTKHIKELTLLGTALAGEEILSNSK